MIKDNIEPKTWDEFRATGLFLFINLILQAFGWVIVAYVEEGKVSSCGPARTKFRGFEENKISEAHDKIARYLAENARNFPEEIK